MESLFRILFLLSVLSLATVSGSSFSSARRNFSNPISFEEPLEPCIITNEDGNGRPTIGVCGSLQYHLKKCPPLYDMFKDRQFGELRKHFCSPPGSLNPKICCSLDSYTGVPKQDQEPTYKYHRNYNLLPHHVCGENNIPVVSNRIRGGNNANVAQFPWMARIGYQNLEAQTFHCSGAIINKRYILTAAHCFNEEVDGKWIVRLAEHNEKKDVECITVSDGSRGQFRLACGRAQDYNVEKFIVHPKFQYDEDTRSNLVNDIALIRLDRDIDFRSCEFSQIVLKR